MDLIRKSGLECDRPNSLNTYPYFPYQSQRRSSDPPPFWFNFRSPSQISAKSALPSSTSNFLSLLTKFPFLYHNIHLHLSQSRLRFNTPWMICYPPPLFGLDSYKQRYDINKESTEDYLPENVSTRLQSTVLRRKRKKIFNENSVRNLLRESYYFFDSLSRFF